MGATNARYKARIIIGGEWVEGFYYQELNNGVIRHYIRDYENIWEIDPSTLKLCRYVELEDYENPTTTISDVKELQEKLAQVTINFIKERNLNDIWGVYFSIDGLEDDAIKYGEWVPTMDSCISVEGLQKQEPRGWRVRKLIGEYM